jgi:hypothetical protein
VHSFKLDSIFSKRAERWLIVAINLARSQATRPLEWFSSFRIPCRQALDLAIEAAKIPDRVSVMAMICGTVAPAGKHPLQS